jgi:hypothetical protein
LLACLPACLPAMSQGPVQDLKCSNFLQTYAIDLIFFSMDRGEQEEHEDTKGHMMQGLVHTLSHFAVHSFEHEK